MVVCSGESTGYGDAAGPDPGSQWYRNLSVVGGPQSVAAPFTKWSNAAADVCVLYGMVKRAGELAAQAPAGPVYVNTPVEVLLAPVAARSAPTRPRPRAPVVTDRVARATWPRRRRRVAARLLAAAQQPGARDRDGRPRSRGVRGARRARRAARAAGRRAAVGALLELPAGQPLHAGGELAPLATDADLVVLLGCRAPWYPPCAKPGNATVLVIDEVPHRPHIAYQVLTADHYVGGGWRRPCARSSPRSERSASTRTPSPPAGSG